LGVGTSNIERGKAKVRAPQNLATPLERFKFTLALAPTLSQRRGERENAAEATGGSGRGSPSPLPPFVAVMSSGKSVACVSVENLVVPATGEAGDGVCSAAGIGGPPGVGVSEVGAVDGVGVGFGVGAGIIAV